MRALRAPGGLLCGLLSRGCTMSAEEAQPESLGARRKEKPGGARRERWPGWCDRPRGRKSAGGGLRGSPAVGAALSRPASAY